MPKNDKPDGLACPKILGYAGYSTFLSPKFRVGAFTSPATPKFKRFDLGIAGSAAGYANPNVGYCAAFGSAGLLPKLSSPAGALGA